MEYLHLHFFDGGKFVSQLEFSPYELASRISFDSGANKLLLIIIRGGKGIFGHGNPSVATFACM